MPIVLSCQLAGDISLGYSWCPGKGKAKDASEALMVSGKPPGWAHALTPTSGIQMGFNCPSHIMPPLGIALEQLRAWVVISRRLQRPGNNPCLDEAFAEVPCAYLSPGTGTRPFGTQVPRAANGAMAPQASPSHFTVTLGLCHVPSLSTRVRMEHTHTRAPAVLLRSACAQRSRVAARGSAQSSGMGITDQSMEEGERAVLSSVPLQACGALSPPLAQPSLSGPMAGFSCCHRAVGAPGGGLLGKGMGHHSWAYVFLVVSLVPCTINSNVPGVSLHREGVRTVAFLSFACKSMSEARSLREDNGWAEFVLSPCLTLPLSS